MLRDPVRYPFRKWKMIERFAKFADRSTDLDHFIDGARVSRVLRTHQPDIERRDLRMFQPGPAEEIPPPHSEAAGLRRCLFDRSTHLGTKTRSGTLIRIENQHPGVGESHLKRSVA